MAAFNKQAFVDYLNSHLSSQIYGEGACAKHVRLGLAAGGLKPVTWPVPAKSWGGTLLALGFVPVPQVGYVPALGDVAVMQPVNAGDAGHIEGYDGTKWVSDFAQTGFWPSRAYAANKGAFTIYRYPQ
jgi:hypothetical protein